MVFPSWKRKSRIEWHQEEKVPKPLQLGIRGEIHSARAEDSGRYKLCVFVEQVPKMIFVVGDFTMVTHHVNIC